MDIMLIVFSISAFLAIASIVILSFIILRSVSRKGKEEGVVKGWLLGVLIGLLILNIGLAIFFFLQIHERVNSSGATRQQESARDSREEDREEQEELRSTRETEEEGREERRTGSLFDVTPRDGFEIMELQSLFGGAVLEVPVNTTGTYILHEGEWRVDFWDSGLDVTVERRFSPNNLDYHLVEVIEKNARVLEGMDDTLNVVVHEEVIEIENGLLQKITYTYERRDEEIEGKVYVMVFAYYGEIILVELRRRNTNPEPYGDCLEKTLKEVLGFNYFLEGELYICSICDPARWDHLEISMEESPFGENLLEPFQMVMLRTDTIRLYVPVQNISFIPFYVPRYVRAEVYGVEIRIDLVETATGAEADEFSSVVEHRMRNILREMEEGGAQNTYTEIELSEIYEIENGAMQWVTFYFSNEEYSVSNREGRSYVMAFPYLGHYVTVRIHAKNLEGHPNFEEGLELAREVYGVNRFLESE